MNVQTAWHGIETAFFVSQRTWGNIPRSYKGSSSVNIFKSKKNFGVQKTDRQIFKKLHLSTRLYIEQ